MTRRLLLLIVLAAGCVDQPGAIECATGIVCGEGTICAAAQPVCISSPCGNGRVDPGEACDDGNIVPGDGCSPSCATESCGNGATEPGERCDDGNTSNGDGCSSDCLSLEVCGNEIVDVGEGCDDGNTVAGDGCRADCEAIEFCGNGLVDPNEVCDDGMAVGGPCAPDCLSGTGCGNGFVDVPLGEECDDGNTVDSDDCRYPSCKHAVCGDGVTNTAGVRLEQCDGGTTGVPTETAACNVDCTVAMCGDAKVNQTSGEQCDNGKDVNDQQFDSMTCDSDCTAPVCGDNHVNAAKGEACDPGMVGLNVETCDNDCTTPACGDSHTNPAFTPTGGMAPEGCDDGGTMSGDGCSSVCRIESCGNGVVDPGEQCDDMDLDDLDECRNNCRTPACGDGVKSTSEVCDDGMNTASCDIDCSMPMCNDGIQNAAAGEQCEDGNTMSGDGCSSSCKLEPFALTVALAGNGVGLVTSNPPGINCGSDCSEIYTLNTMVTLTAAPEAQSVFMGWSGSCTGTGTCTVTMSQARSVTATFEKNRLTVLKQGTGTGNIASNPAGITCGATCSADYDVNTSVTLTATPTSDSVFTGWTGGGCTGTGPCTVAMTQATTVLATFTLTQFNLAVTKSGTGDGTVTSAPAGIDCGTTCDANFTANTMVTLFASPAGDSTFTGWSGACTGTGNCTVTMSQTRMVTAAFALKPVTLTVTTTAGGKVTSSPLGIDCGNDCTEDFTVGTTVTLTAEPANNRAFTGWGGACAAAGTSLTCMVTMDAAKTVSATFETNRLTVSRVGSGSGTVTSNPGGINCGNSCQANYNHGTSVTLTANAGSGSVFTGWSGGGCTGTGTCVVSMTGPITVEATFELGATVTINKNSTNGGDGTVTSSPAGIDCGADCSHLFITGTVVTLTATPVSGSTFVGWTGGPCSGTAPCTFTVTTPVVIQAEFALPLLTVARAGSGSGTVTSNPAGINCGSDCNEAYGLDTMVTLTAAPTSGVFTGWSGGGCSGTGTCTVTMDASKTVTANFDVQFTLVVQKSGTGTGTVTSSPAGIDCGSTCDSEFVEGTMVTLTAAADAGSTFTTWSGDCTSCGSSTMCAVAMTAGKTCTATFDPDPPTIETTTLPPGQEGSMYGQAIMASGGSGSGYTWQVVSGALPMGLTLGATGTPSTTLSGTPAAGSAGNYNFMVEVTDSVGGTDTQAYTLVIDSPPP